MREAGLSEGGMTVSELLRLVKRLLTGYRVLSPILKNCR